MSSPQQNLRQLAADRGESLANLSAVIGRNAAYLQQFVARGSPRRLDDDDRLFLAQHLNVSERLLGARDPWEPCG
ncbi:hypothetical protein D9601_03470 [Sphingomonas sp. MA1305]|uniref:hypothetical protein n=1 Tax=Sphingomonas sp. MA1305 TaxID=2479204 RepID=UPI0018DEFD2B|nr:hypothetical protein [Sphingomonas sp. MA1305]MBI0474424.1 hypothetical protein [Sphingomonas sp. MA1305]